MQRGRADVDFTTKRTKDTKGARSAPDCLGEHVCDWPGARRPFVSFVFFVVPFDRSLPASQHTSK